MKQFKKTESVEEFLARGGSVKKLQSINDLREIKNFKKTTGGEVYTRGAKSSYRYDVTQKTVGSEFFVKKHPWKNNGK